MIKILLVDDEEYICSLVKELLGEVGFEVVVAFSNEKALQILRKDTFELVLLEPVIGGIKLCEEIRADEKLKKLRCAFFSTLSKAEIGEETIKKLEVDYISKSFDNDAFVEKVKELVK